MWRTYSLLRAMASFRCLACVSDNYSYSKPWKDFTYRSKARKSQQTSSRDGEDAMVDIDVEVEVLSVARQVII
jgi:hypothetical protein